jgi:hypothetical protein
VNFECPAVSPNGPPVRVYRADKAVKFSCGTRDMNALSSWTVALCCPHCGRTGSGTISEGARSGQKEACLRVDELSTGSLLWNYEPAPGKIFDARLAVAPR